MTTSCSIPSPLGPLVARLDDDGAVLGLAWEPRSPQAATPAPVQLVRELGEYFSGRRTDFTVEIRPDGTEFQAAVWNQVMVIPFAETSSYQAIAVALCKPGAARAVGQANARNPISVLIPCHRVLGSGGDLRGYGGGEPIKRALLDLERGASHLRPDG